MSFFSQSHQRIVNIRFVSFLEDTQAVDKYLEKNTRYCYTWIRSTSKVGKFFYSKEYSRFNSNLEIKKPKKQKHVHCMSEILEDALSLKNR